MKLKNNMKIVLKRLCFLKQFQDASGGIWKLDLSFTHTVSIQNVNVLF